MTQAINASAADGGAGPTGRTRARSVRSVQPLAVSVSPSVLKNVPMFAKLPEESLRLLAAVVTKCSAPRGTVVMAAGDPIDSLYIVISGRLKVMMSDAEGKEVILSILGSGEVFGEMGVIDDSPRSASVIAIEPCEMLCVNRRDFDRCLAENFDMAQAIMRGLVKRLREADRKIISLALLDVYGRVARLLIELAEDLGGQKILIKRLSKQDIAKMVGASREMVSRVMRDLQLGGLIEMRGSSIVLRETILRSEPGRVYPGLIVRKPLSD
jgi:CRP/FNR family transcriptional regulator, cyclic AMP receptor protein